MKPIIKWQTYPTNASARWLGVELSVKSNEKGKFEATVYIAGQRPEKDHACDSLADGMAWCEKELNRFIGLNIEPSTGIFDLSKSAENPLQGIELSQDFLALKPNNEQVWR